MWVASRLTWLRHTHKPSEGLRLCPPRCPQPVRGLQKLQKFPRAQVLRIPESS